MGMTKSLRFSTGALLSSFVLEPRISFGDESLCDNGSMLQGMCEVTDFENIRTFRYDPKIQKNEFVAT
uniref:Uncharacterized protein n=1 Tax=Romanomermis culicivorax TaxID=13658 RepID=A0A915J479_ROMCU